MNSGWFFVLAFLPVTTQLSLRSEGADVDADGKEDDPVYDFGGFFAFVGRAKEEEEQQQLVQLGRKITETSDLAGPWKAPLASGEAYPGSASHPLFSTRQCTDHDVWIHRKMALERAKKQLPDYLYANDFKTGQCYKTASSSSNPGWNMTSFLECYQQTFNVTTPCATCIGAVFNMAKHNMSTHCYDLCKGRPHRWDGTHWCWEDCQSCMYYIGRKMTECYGEPYDMQCRFAKEINREKWYEKNGINPNSPWNPPTYRR